MCRQVRLDELEPLLTVPLLSTAATAGRGGGASGGGAVELCELLSSVARCAEPAFSGMAIEAIGRLSSIDSNEPALVQMALAHPELLRVLIAALSELHGTSPTPSADELVPPLHPPASALQEAAVEALVTLTSGSSLKLRICLAAERMLVPRLLRLVSTPAASGAHIARRAAQILVHLADAPECHDALRQHEWMMMHMALHDPQSSGPLVSEVLDLLGER